MTEYNFRTVSLGPLNVTIEGLGKCNVIIPGLGAKECITADDALPLSWFMDCAYHKLAGNHEQRPQCILVSFDPDRKELVIKL